MTEQMEKYETTLYYRDVEQYKMHSKKGVIMRRITSASPEYHHEPCPVCHGKMIREYGIGVIMLSCEDHPNHPSYMGWKSTAAREQKRV